jgi:hypothetical protein
VGYLSKFKKTAERKHPTNGRIFAQSGYPAVVLRMFLNIFVANAFISHVCKP